MNIKQGQRLAAFIQEYNIAIMLIFFTIASIIITEGKWLSTANIFNILSRASILGILAIAQSIILISGQIDLSIGSFLALFCGIYSYFFLGGYGILISLLVPSILILTLGIFNGAFASRTTIPPFVITLGTMMTARSMHYFILGSARYIPELQRIIYSVVESFPKGQELFPAIIWVIMFLFFSYFLNSTKWGKHTYAVGGEERTARVTGVPVKKMKFLVFIISALLVIVASFIFLYRVAYVGPNTGETYLLDSIAAPVIGGIYLFGGRGRLWKAIIGALFLEILVNFMHLIGINPLIFPAVKGALIAIGVVISIALTPAYLRVKVR